MTGKGLTRRQFLIGGGVALGALAAGGVVAQRTLPLRRYYNEVMGLCGPPGPVPPDRVKPSYGVFRSEVLGADVEYGWWAPVISYPWGFRFPVVYCLPGRGEGPRWVLDAPLYLADFAAAPLAGGALRTIALVSIDGGGSYWHAREGGEDRMAMLLREFIPWFEDRNDVGGSRERRAVMGWSMGGYGAILAAERHRSMFSALCAVSPALWHDYDDVPGDAFDDEQDYLENDVFSHASALLGAAVRVDCGRGDVFFNASRDFARQLNDVEGDVLEEGGRKGCHDPDYWRRVAPAEIDFLARSLGTAQRD